MYTFFMYFQVVVIILLIISVLLQNSGSDGLAGLASSGNNFLSGRTASNIFSKATISLGIIFMLNSIILARFAVIEMKHAKSVIESIADNKTKVIDTNTVPEAK